MAMTNSVISQLLMTMSLSLIFIHLHHLIGLMHVYTGRIIQFHPETSLSRYGMVNFNQKVFPTH